MKGGGGGRRDWASQSVAKTPRLQGPIMLERRELELMADPIPVELFKEAKSRLSRRSCCNAKRSPITGSDYEMQPFGYLNATLPGSDAGSLPYSIEQELIRVDRSRGTRLFFVETRILRLAQRVNDGTRRRSRAWRARGKKSDSSPRGPPPINVAALADIINLSHS